MPRNTKGRLDCVSNSAWVTWDASEGALSYFVLAQEVGGHNSSCTTASSPCNVPDLNCGTLYTFHVTAVNNYCHNNDSTTFELETGIYHKSLLSIHQFWSLLSFKGYRTMHCQPIIYSGTKVLTSVAYVSDSQPFWLATPWNETM